MRYTSQLTTLIKPFNVLYLFAIISSVSYSKCANKPITIGVVDTGFGYQDRGGDARLCNFGHKDFTIKNRASIKFTSTSPEVPLDTMGHGTNIVGIIESYLKDSKVNYCIIIIKYFSQDEDRNLENTRAAFKYAKDLKIDYVNYSSGGDTADRRESVVVKEYLDAGGVLIAAAGNDSKNLDLFLNGFYPATYDKRVVSVGMLEKNGVQSKMSNYGKIIKRWEVGRSVVGYGLRMSGTSQATATATGKIVSQNLNKCDIGK